MPANLTRTFLAAGVAVALYPASALTPPSPAAAEPAQQVGPPSQPHRIPISGDRLYYIEATCHSNRVRMLVDSGANTTLFTRSDARRLGIAMNGLIYQRGLRTAKGDAALAFTQLPTMTIAGRTYQNVRVAVSAGEIGVSLLGQDILSRFRHVAIDDGVMTLI